VVVVGIGVGIGIDIDVIIVCVCVVVVWFFLWMLMLGCWVVAHREAALLWRLKFGRMSPRGTRLGDGGGTEAFQPLLLDDPTGLQPSTKTRQPVVFQSPGSEAILHQGGRDYTRCNEGGGQHVEFIIRHQ
jgi:hypothetical protein